MSLSIGVETDWRHSGKCVGRISIRALDRDALGGSQLVVNRITTMYVND